MSELTDSITPVEEMVAKAESGGRHQAGGFSGKVIVVVAFSWSVFQMLLPQFLLLNSEIVRSVHLAFAIALVFLSFPALKKTGIVGRKAVRANVFKTLWREDRVSWTSWILAIVSATSALYLAIDYVGIGERQGLPNTQDIVSGTILIVLLLEAARRSLGPALPLIASTFIIYSFFSEFGPSVIAFKNATPTKIINKLTMGSEGIFGVPLYVSASTVYLFVLFGAILEKAGGGKFFIDLAFSLLGRYRGGPGKAAVLASGLTGMVSGSSIANVVTTGTFTIPLMKKGGYSGIKAGAIEVAASTNGQLMPPIMGAAAFIIAEYAGMSYFEVVKAAAIPAIVSYIALIYITHLEAIKLNLKGISKDKLPRFFSVLAGGWHFLLPLFFLFYELIALRISAQLAVYHSILILMSFIFINNLWNAFQDKGKNLIDGVVLSLKEIAQAFIAGGKNMMSIGVAVAAAGIIVGIVTIGLGGVVVDLIDFVSGGNLFLLLIITAFVSLLLGMGLPTTANYIVMASLTVPAILQLSGEMGLAIPLIAGHLFCFYFGILADDTPPVGLAAYAAAAISKEDPIKTGIQGFIYDMRTAILPFMFIFNTDLLLIGIDSWWRIAVVFVTALVAMFAFANITQGYVLVKNRFYETLLLLGSCALLFRPYFFSDRLPVGLVWVYVGGFALYALVIGLQYRRRSLVA